MRGEADETELLSETIEGTLEESENAGEVKGVSMGRLMAGRVKMGDNCVGVSTDGAVE